MFYVSFSQSKQDYHWFFGLDKSSSEVDLGYKIDFNRKPISIPKFNVGITFNSANASVSDREGNLLFYTNGCAVLNKNAEIMPNGDSLSFDIYWDISGWNNCQSLGYPAFNDFLILEDPSNSNMYYIIQKPYVFESWENYSMKYIWYSKVDMSLNGGLGDVVDKNVILFDERQSLSSYLTAINHINGSDWWVLQPLKDTNIYLTFLIDENGIHKEHEQAIGKIFDWNASASGTARFSPDGTKYAYYNESDGLILLDFDRSTGILSNYEQVFPFDTIGHGIFCSVEWSPNSRFIYTASKYYLHQIDTWEECLKDGVRLIDTYNGTKDPFSTTFFLMALAPDCRIYMCPTNSTNSYHIINQPDSLGVSCNFVQNGIKLPITSGAGSMPNFPRFRVDEDEKCDPSIVSVFGDFVWYRRNLKVWPNPTSDILNINFHNNDSGKLIVTNINGQILLQENIIDNINEKQINLSHLPTGRYNIEYYSDKSDARVFYGVQVIKTK